MVAVAVVAREMAAKKSSSSVARLPPPHHHAVVRLAKVTAYGWLRAAMEARKHLHWHYVFSPRYSICLMVRPPLQPFIRRRHSVADVPSYGVVRSKENGKGVEGGNLYS
ncbi:hypothetical protein EYF80_055615 [Liparis tanakae]|uniref:Uncharacterized protein n=1 Tax=Liparis tanakae TaxID=230148 RepID=A0A4Z2EZV0_9TELE|nr:hypothetical protein EYF80_055615 [Liparis tanakae]